MNILLRLLLLIMSTGALFFVLKRIRDSQVQIESAVSWILFMFGLILVSLFPGLAISVSRFIGIESTANFVFLCIIFLLLLKVFDLSLEVSKLQYHIRQLTQIVSLDKCFHDSAEERILKGEESVQEDIGISS